MSRKLVQHARITLVALSGTAVLGACGVGGPEEAGGDFPSKDVKVVVPFGAGGPASLAAQASGDCMGESLGSEFVVENKPGGTGAVGMRQVDEAKADGYTLGVGSIGNLVLAPLLNQEIGYTPEDYVSIGTIYQIPSVIAVPGTSKHTDIESLFAEAKKKSKSLSMATPGNTTMQNTEMKRLSKEYGVTFKLVPYNGTAEALTAVLGGNADAMFLEASQTVQENIESGQLVVLASGTPERVSFLDNVPTMKELGYPEITNSTVFFGLVAPQGTPEDVVATLESSLNKCLESKDVRNKLDERFVPEPFIGSADQDSHISSAVDVARKNLDR